MKKRIISMVIAIVIVFSVSSVAFATISDTAMWSSTICKTQFTTSDYISKPSGEGWEWFSITVGNVQFSNTSVSRYLYATPKSGSVTIGSQTKIYNAQTKDLEVGGVSYNQIKLLIKNPYSANNYNMQSNGSWDGEYE